MDALDLSPTHDALDTYHQRFEDESLPESLSRKAFAAFDATAYTDEERAWGRAAWQMRALDEYRSQVAFTELLHELTQLGASFDVIGTCVRVVRDEARHVELCRRMVLALGGTSVIPGAPNWVTSSKALPLRERVLATALSSLCIGETLSVRLLAAVRDETVDPLTRAVITTFVADESIHGRFGWAILDCFLPDLTDADRRLIYSVVPTALAGARSAAMPARHVLEAEAQRVHVPSPFGSLGARRRAEIFEKTVTEDILARFHAVGLSPPVPDGLFNPVEH